jgi:hypothetical protein
METSSDPERGPDGQPAVPPDPVVSTTLGTGSVLGIGCLVAVTLLVLVAFAIRWFAGSW